MKEPACTWLVIRALYQLARYDVIHALLKNHGIRQQLAGQPIGGRSWSGKCETTIVDACQLAFCFYWKPVLCLQRSVCLVRLLRRYGVDAHLVIGYRPVPFLSHAWVEVDGRVVNDSSAYKDRLRRLLIV